MRVFGLTGSISAGKQTVAEYLMKQYDFAYLVLSDIVKEEAKKHGLKPSKYNHQTMGNILRKQHGTDVLAKKMVERLNEGIFLYSLIDDSSKASDAIGRGLKGNYIIDGIRNPGEAAYLKKNIPYFVLLAVDADPKKRFERMKKRKKLTDVFTYEEFKRINKRDQGEKESFGQGVRKCIEMADVKLLNNKGRKELYAKVDKLVKSKPELFMEKLGTKKALK